MPNGIHDAVQYAHAKLTLRLHITGLRDDGFHLLDAEMVSLDFCDLLTFSPGEGIEVLGSAVDGIPLGPENLISRALALAERPARVCLEKRIPPGAGLGGGSADAAAALRWAGLVDVEAAASLGSDVPFCIRGGRSRVTGVGEKLEELPFQEKHFTLLVPPLHVSTVDVYKAYDASGSSYGPDVANHLEEAATTVEPGLIRWRDELERSTGVRPTLAGSGSTWFVEGSWPRPDDLAPEVLWVRARATHSLPLT